MFLGPDVIWNLHTREGTRTTQGVEPYLSTIQTAYGDGSDTFTCEMMIIPGDQLLVTAVLINNHGERSLDIFRFEEGLIVQEDEYLLGDFAMIWSERPG